MRKETVIQCIPMSLARRTSGLMGAIPPTRRLMTSCSRDPEFIVHIKALTSEPPIVTAFATPAKVLPTSLDSVLAAAFVVVQ